MKTHKFFELIASSKEGETDARFRVFVELTDKDQDFWESQALGTPAGRDQMNALRSWANVNLSASLYGTPNQIGPLATRRRGRRIWSPYRQTPGRETRHECSSS